MIQECGNEKVNCLDIVLKDKISLVKLKHRNDQFKYSGG